MTFIPKHLSFFFCPNHCFVWTNSATAMRTFFLCFPHTRSTSKSCSRTHAQAFVYVFACCFMKRLLSMILFSSKEERRLNQTAPSVRMVVKLAPSVLSRRSFPTFCTRVNCSSSSSDHILHFQNPYSHLTDPARLLCNCFKFISFPY